MIPVGYQINNTSNFYSADKWRSSPVKRNYLDYRYHKTRQWCQEMHYARVQSFAKKSELVCYSQQTHYSAEAFLDGSSLISNYLGAFDSTKFQTDRHARVSANARCCLLGHSKCTTWQANFNRCH